MPPNDRDEVDEERRCDRCGERFWFRVGEQRFFARRGLADPPRHCAACLRARKAEARQGPPTALTGSVPRTRSGPSMPVPVLPRCAWCGAPARVPFHVAAHRPVACEACYRWRLGVGSGLTED